MVEPASSLQVTALLDELLGVAPGREAAEAAAAEASVAPSMQGTITAPDRPASPHAAQLAQLCGEIENLATDMDDCIASIGRWKEENRQRREALERELERCYGNGRAPLAAEIEVQDVTDDLSRMHRDDLELELEACYGIGRSSTADNALALPEAYTTDSSPARGLYASMRCEASPTTPLASAEQVLAAAAREAAEDEARIAKLREEVEQLRCCRRGQLSGESTTDLGLSPHGPEREALLLQHLEDSLGQMPFDMDVDEEISELEGRLQDARSYIGQVEDAIGDSNFSVDAEISELEHLLNECDAARAQMSPAVA